MSVSFRDFYRFEDKKQNRGLFLSAGTDVRIFPYVGTRSWQDLGCCDTPIERCCREAFFSGLAEGRYCL